MKRLGNLALMLLILGASILAESQSGAGAGPTNKTVSTRFEAILTKTLDARKSQVGDIVIARTGDDVRLQQDVQIPKNAKLIGRITEVQVKGRGGSDSRIGVLFEKALMRDGREVSLTVVIDNILANADPATQDQSRAGAAAFVDVSSSKDIQIETAKDADRVVSVLHSKASNLRVESGARLMLTVIQK